MSNGPPLRIIHCFRSPIGGIFRHVRDLAEFHARQGHDVGVLCDSTTGGSFEDALFDEIRPYLSLGLFRLPIRRAVSPGDFAALWKSYREIRSLQPNILHGHGAKGGAIARLIGVNVTATLQLTHLLLPLLREQPRALLVNLGSTFGSIGYPGFATYCASKFALRGFSDALRRELADTHIKVLYVAPRATRTAMNSVEVVAMNDALKVSMDDPQAVAAQIVQAIMAEREELYLGWPEKLFVRLNSLLPRLVDQALRKQLPVIKRFARADQPRPSHPFGDHP